MNDILKTLKASQPSLTVPTSAVDTLTRMQHDSDWTRRLFQENSGVQRLLADMNRGQELLRASIGPLTELRAHHVALFESPMHKQALAALAGYEERFRLPEMFEVGRLATEQMRGMFEQANRQHDLFANAMKASAQMHTPWLDMSKQIESFQGFAKLQDIGRTLTSMQAFSDDVGVALRRTLGDWRDPITWPEDIFHDIGARASFYAERGFDPEITSFPAPAFREALDIAELGREPPPLVALYGPPIAPPEDAEEEAGLERTNLAHKWLMQLETQLRSMIDVVMTGAFGPDWPRHRLPNGFYDKWVEKKRVAEKAGAPVLPLIAYADFTDYMPLIGRADNWKLFEPFFHRVESVRESFQRLHPIRICTMHARIITQDDEIILYAETRQIWRAIAPVAKEKVVTESC